MWFGLPNTAAQTTFNNRYGDINFNDSTVFSNNNCLSIGYADSAIIATYEENFSGSPSYIGFVRVDFNGGVISENYLEKDSIWLFLGNNSSLFKTANGDILEIGSQQMVGDEFFHPKIYRFTNQGDTVWTKFYEFFSDKPSNGQQIIEMDNGDLVAVARTVADTIDNNPQFIVFKTDAQGNLIWMNEYGVSNTIGEYGVTIIENNEGGFFVGGQYKSAPGVPSDNMLVKIDQTAQEVWTQTFGNEFDDGAVMLTALSNGEYIMSGSLGVDDAINPDPFVAMLRKFDIDGLVLWEKVFGDTTSVSAFYSVVEDWDNNLIVAGETINNGWRSGTLLKTNFDGDSIWMRSYRLFESNAICFLRDVIPLPDSSYAAAGYVSVIQPNPHVGQDVWVFKVDEHGCLEPGCHLINGLESINIGLQNSMEVYPNPVKDQLNIQFNLPPSGSFGDQKNNQLLILNPVGQIVLEETLNMFRNHESFTTELNLSHLAPGLYTLHWLSNRGWLDSVTILKH